MYSLIILKGVKPTPSIKQFGKILRKINITSNPVMNV